jgi:hypothetical protein
MLTANQKKNNTPDDILDSILNTPEGNTDYKPELELVETDDEEILEENSDDSKELEDSEDNNEEEEEEVEEDLIQSDEDDEEEDESDAAQSGDNEPYLEVTDEDLIEVKIDGEVVYKTIGEAKAALSGDGAIQKRLKDATILKQQAEQEQLSGAMDLEQKRTEFNNYVAMLDSVLFQPTVSPPDQNLRKTDPNRYLEQVEAYQNDQKRMTDGRAALSENMHRQQTQQAETLAKFQNQQGAVLAEKLPVLLDEVKGPKAKKAIADAAEHYGFSLNEVAGVVDHRVFLMAHDAAQFRALKAHATLKGKTLDLENDNVRPARKLRSGVAKKRSAQRQSAKVRKSVVNKAQQSGKVDDIVATLMKPAGK